MDERTPYRGLLVDWGGVMTTNVFDAFRAFCEVEGLSPQAVGERFRRDPQSRELLVGLETGHLPEAEFETRFAAILEVPAENLIARLFAGGRAEEPMHEAVRRARAAGVRTVMVSNSWGTDRYDRALLGELFDASVISGEVGVRKPSTEIYELATEAIGLPAGACVFVDDLEFNLRPAQALGMATIHHVNTAETITQLERLLALELR